MAVARNAPCSCGSGKKYKKCCLKKEAQERRGVTAEADARAAEIMNLAPLPPWEQAGQILGMDNLGGVDYGERMALLMEHVGGESELGEDTYLMIDLIDSVQAEATAAGDFERFEALGTRFCQREDVGGSLLASACYGRLLNALSGQRDDRLPEIVHELAQTDDPSSAFLSCAQECLMAHGDEGLFLQFMRERSQYARENEDRADLGAVEEIYRLAELYQQALTSADGAFTPELADSYLATADDEQELTAMRGLLHRLSRAEGAAPPLHEYAVERRDNEGPPQRLARSDWRLSSAGHGALLQLTIQFSRWGVQERGEPWPRMWLAACQLDDYLRHRVAGRCGTLPERAERLPGAVLYPDRDSVERSFESSPFGIGAHAPAALAVALAYWFDFLVARDLLDACRAAELRAEVRPVVAAFATSLETRSLDTTVAPVVRRAWKMTPSTP